MAVPLWRDALSSLRDPDWIHQWPSRCGGMLYPVFAIPIGFEPMAACLEGRCSIQLSYGINNDKGGMKKSRPYGQLFLLSGRPDSN